MTPNEIKEHLRLHALYLQGDTNGKRAVLYGANLRGANLRGADLRSADLYGADLRGADLYGANLRGADLRSADLSGANLRGANLFGADLYGANLKQTLLENKAILTFQFNRHTAYYFGLNEIQIGCHKHSIEHWLTEFAAIGKQNGYTEDEIVKYGKFIKGCANIQKEMK